MMAVADERIALADHELVAAARAGAVGAFDALIDRHYAPLRRYLIRQTGDPELAADLTQESFAAAFRRLDQLAEDRSFAAWLYRIARNELRMAQRRRRLVRFLSLDWLVTQRAAKVARLEQPDATEYQAEHDLIQQALDALSPSLREALVLHRLWGFSGREVAQILEISVAAARKRISRADAEFRMRYAVMQGGSES